LLHP